MRSVILTLGLIVVLVFALSASALAAPQAPAAVYTWNGGTGDWGTAINWTPNGIPGLTDTAVINNGTVNVTSNVTLQNFALNGGILQGSASLTVTQVMTWSGGTQSGSGATMIAPGAALNVTAYVLQRQRTLNNAGTVNWTAA